MSESGLTLGQYLRQEREKHGITLEQVASSTKIGIKLLYALENDQYADLPAKPFVRGFVLSYARFIGLDSKEVLIQYGSFIDQRSHDRPVRDAGHSGYAFEKRENEHSRTLLWAVMGSFIVFGGLVMVFLKPSLHRSHRGHVEKLRAAHTNPSLAVPSEAPEVRPTQQIVFVPSGPTGPIASTGTLISTHQETTTQISPSSIPSLTPPPSPKATLAITVPSPVPPPEDPLHSGLDLAKTNPKSIHHKAIFKAIEDVWIKYRVDEKPTMKFILRKGRILVLRAQKKIAFQTANPKALDMSYNQKAYQSLSEETQLDFATEKPVYIFPRQAVESISLLFDEGGGKTEGSAPASTPHQPLSTSGH